MEDRSFSAGGQIAVEFEVNINPPYLVVKMVPEESWISPEFANPNSPAPLYLLHKILTHERVHYMIYCLLIREGNKALQSGGDPHEMLDLVVSVSKRINSQYDHATEHGENQQAQVEWEMSVQQQFEDVTLRGMKKIIELQNMQP